MSTLQAFVETRLERGYDYGAQGGPEYNTTVIAVKSGQEWRNSNWSSSRGSWQIGQRNINKADKDYLISFFRARRGKAVGFRFKDWSDYKADGEALAIDGSPTAQLIKTYSDGGIDAVRTIKKPVAGTISVSRAGVAIGPVLDTATGVLTFAADAQADISAVTAANPAAITSTAHGRSSGDVLYLTGTGIAGVDGKAWTITVTGTDTFTIPYDNSAGSPAAAGHWALYPQPGETVTWSGEFDVPVRFDTDQFQVDFLAYRDADGAEAFQLHSLPVVELLLL